MSRELLIVILASFVVVMPFTGFPGTWKTFVFFVAGMLIIGLALLIRQERLWFFQRQRKTDAYTENSHHDHSQEPQTPAL
jgi:hypothetical protein